MARTRARRRRQNTLLLVALVVTLVVLLFARDVSRSAHSARAVRRSEDRTFGQLANGLLGAEAQFSSHLAYLLVHGATLGRPVFAARLAQLADQLPSWSTEASLLRRPALAHGVNATFERLTEQRVDDYQAAVDAVAATLDLPWQRRSTTSLTPALAAASLLETDAQWAVARWSLVKEPGRVQLAGTSTPKALADLTSTLGSLGGAKSLAVIRAVGISAVGVTPSPLPAPPGEILLPPVTAMRLGVTVTNWAYVLQPVALDVTLTPVSGVLPAYHQHLGVVLGPLRSYAFVIDFVMSE